MHALVSKQRLKPVNRMRCSTVLLGPSDCDDKECVSPACPCTAPTPLLHDQVVDSASRDSDSSDYAFTSLLSLHFPALSVLLSRLCLFVPLSVLLFLAYSYDPPRFPHRHVPLSLFCCGCCISPCAIVWSGIGQQMKHNGPVGVRCFCTVSGYSSCNTVAATLVR